MLQRKKKKNRKFLNQAHAQFPEIGLAKTMCLQSVQHSHEQTGVGLQKINLHAKLMAQKSHHLSVAVAAM